jgi:hypothetical protein
MSLVITDTQEVGLSISPVDKKGHPAKVDGPPVWTSSDDSIATVSAAEDGLSAVVSANVNLGKAQINVSADADLGEGQTSITGTLEIEVVAGEAVSLAINAGTPSEQTPPPAPPAVAPVP